MIWACPRAGFRGSIGFQWISFFEMCVCRSNSGSSQASIESFLSFTHDHSNTAVPDLLGLFLATLIVLNSKRKFTTFPDLYVLNMSKHWRNHACVSISSELVQWMWSKLDCLIVFTVCLNVIILCNFSVRQVDIFWLWMSHIFQIRERYLKYRNIDKPPLLLLLSVTILLQHNIVRFCYVFFFFFSSLIAENCEDKTMSRELVCFIYCQYCTWNKFSLTQYNVKSFENLRVH